MAQCLAKQTAKHRCDDFYCFGYLVGSVYYGDDLGIKRTTNEWRGQYLPVAFTNTQS